LAGQYEGVHSPSVTPNRGAGCSLNLYLVRSGKFEDTVIVYSARRLAGHDKV
jgi:hypothetical protein